MINLFNAPVIGNILSSSLYATLDIICKVLVRKVQIWEGGSEALERDLDDSESQERLEIAEKKSRDLQKEVESLKALNIEQKETIKNLQEMQHGVEEIEAALSGILPDDGNFETDSHKSEGSVLEKLDDTTDKQSMCGDNVDDLGQEHVIETTTVGEFILC